MAGERAAYMGPSLRRLRRDLGLTQSGMAADLGVSISYMSLLETNQRPLSADMLLRLARTYKIDMTAFAGDGGAAFTTRLQAALRDPLFADIDLPALQTADVASNYPGITEAFLRLHSAYQQEQLALAERRSDPGAATGSGAGDPVVEVQRFLAAHRNHFPTLEEAGERLAGAIAEAGSIAACLTMRHKLRVRVLPCDTMGGMIRRHDPHHAAIFLDETLSPPERQFQLALQLAYLELGKAFDHILAGTQLSDNGRRLARRTLASYAAAAMLMPHGAFHHAAVERRYDLEVLAHQFGTSIEQVAHRLASLNRVRDQGVPFFLLRFDAAGRVAKRVDGTGLAFAGHAGECPLWAQHRLVPRSHAIATQWLELPDGQRFVSIAFAVTRGGGAHGVARSEGVAALLCAAEHAAHLVYAQVPSEPLPIGITCALCHRERCKARSAPPIGRRILPDDHYRGRAPFRFADD